MTHNAQRNAQRCNDRNETHMKNARKNIVDENINASNNASSIITHTKRRIVDSFDDTTIDNHIRSLLTRYERQRVENNQRALKTTRASLRRVDVHLSQYAFIDMNDAMIERIVNDVHDRRVNTRNARTT